MQKSSFPEWSQDNTDGHLFDYRTFHENLQEKLNPQEITSLNVLGKDFFTLIDYIVSSVFIDHANDRVILGLTMQDFLWELQVFVNQYIRAQVGSVLKLRGYCGKRIQLLQNQLFYNEFMKDVEDAYAKHFFNETSDSSYLV